MSRLLHHDRYALCAAWLLSLIIVIYPIFDFDMYWHLANGREMVSAGRIVSEEIFSFTHAGEAFANHEWLGQIIFYLLWSKFGIYGLFGFKLLLTSGIVWLLYRTQRMVDAPAFVAALLCVFAVFAGINRYHERPELFSLFNTALLSFLLYGFRSQRLSSRALWLIPPLLVVWDWLHGAVYGLTFFGLFFVAENAKHWLPFLRQQTRLSAEHLRTLNRCFALSMLAMLLNPYGLRSYGIFVGYVVGEADFNQVITEFTPLTWAESKVFIVLLAWSVLLTLRHWRKMDVTQLLLLLVFAGFSLRFNRVCGIAALVLVPIVATLLSAALNHGKAAWEANLQRMSLALAAVFILGYGYLVKFSNPLEPDGQHLEMNLYDLSFGYQNSDTFYPVGCVNFIQEVGLSGNMYNAGNMGGYLSYHLTPQRKIFQYNMARVFGDPFYTAEHPETLARWNINYAIVDDEDELNALFPEAQWARVYRDPDAVLVLKRSPENAALIEQHELFFFSPTLSDASLAKRASDPVVLPKLAEEMGEYLAYRRDPRIAARWAKILASQPNIAALPRIQALLKLAQRHQQVNEI